eukprot:4486710-Pyramimonas_sp.AAC.1
MTIVGSALQQQLSFVDRPCRPLPMCGNLTRQMARPAKAETRSSSATPTPSRVRPSTFQTTNGPKLYRIRRLG